MRARERERGAILRALGSAFVLALAGLAAPAALAETDLGDAVLTGEIELGGRVSWGDDDAAKYESYRDLSDGLLSRFDLLLEDQDVTHWLRAVGENMGYRNQRYRAEGGRYGRYRFDLFYGELPLKLSSNAATIYTKDGTDYTLPAGLQAAIEAAPDAATKSGLLSTALDAAVPQKLRSRWIEGRAGGEFHAGENTLLRASYRIQDKRGRRDTGLGFDNPGGNFITLAGPIKERIHEVRAGIDYRQPGWTVSLDYLANLFDNDLDDLVGANPLFATDAAGGASRGRAALAPDNSAHTLTLSGAGSIPSEVPNRISGSVAWSYRRQDEDFLPHTINTAIPSAGLALPQDDLDGEVQILVGHVLATARPSERLSVKLRGRVYDFENETDSVTFTQWVENDTDLQTNAIRAVQNDYTRVNADLGSAYDLTPALTGHLAYAFEYWNRSDDREVEDLYEHGPTAKLDYRVGPRMLAQLDYSFRSRTGSSYDTLAPAKALLGDAAAQAQAAQLQSPLLRKFDEADRNQHELRTLGRFTPTEATELTLNSSWRYARHPESGFGLRSSQGWDVGGDLGWAVHERVALSAYYTYSRDWYKQRQRFRPRSVAPPFTVVDDPVNDWNSKTSHSYHHTGARLNVELVPERLDLEVGYLFQRGRERTTSDTVPGSAFAPAPPPPSDGGNAPDWSRIRDRLHVMSASLGFQLSEQVTLRAQYRFEDYDIDDFRQPKDVFLAGSDVNGDGVVSPSLDVFLQDFVSDYTAHVLGMSAVVRF